MTNFLDSEIFLVLRQAEGPLHYREIVKRILERHVWRTKSLTPDRSVNAALRRLSKEPTTVVSVSRGTYALEEFANEPHEPRLEPTSPSDAYDFIITAFCEGYAHAPRKVVASWYDKRSFCKRVYRGLFHLMETLGFDKAEFLLARTPTDTIVLLRKDTIIPVDK